MNIFISYHYSEAHKYMKELSNFLYKSFKDIFIFSEKTDYRHKGYDDEGIRTIIRDNYMSNCELVIVLLSKNAWKRKHIDWEVSSALRDTNTNPRKGVLIILLQSYGNKMILEPNKTPIRIIRNVKNGFMEVINWNAALNAKKIKFSIEKCLQNLGNILPNNTDPLRRRNTK